MSDCQFTISIVAYENLHLTRACVRSVLEGWAGAGAQIILTDNGSDDGTADYFADLARERPNILIQRYPENIGFIEPNRAAFRKAKGEYFVLLNNDCVVPQTWLATMKVPFLADPKCAVTGNGGGELRESGLGGFKGRIDYIEGHCMMVRTDFVRAVEPNLFAKELVGAYGEDSYLCLQLREAGYTIHVTPIEGLIHHGGATAMMVPRVSEWLENNHAVLRKRFGHYLKTHEFVSPNLHQ